LCTAETSLPALLRRLPMLHMLHLLQGDSHTHSRHFGVG
jgi:hypothetical protein